MKKPLSSQRTLFICCPGAKVLGSSPNTYPCSPNGVTLSCIW